MGRYSSVCRRQLCVCKTQSRVCKRYRYICLLAMIQLFLGKHPCRAARKQQLTAVSTLADVPRTVSDSLAQGEEPRWRIPSSVMSSQWERERESRQGQWAASWDREASVMRMHSSRSIRSSLWQHRASACSKNESENCLGFPACRDPRTVCICCAFNFFRR